MVNIDEDSIFVDDEGIKSSCGEPAESIWHYQLLSKTRRVSNVSCRALSSDLCA